MRDDGTFDPLLKFIAGAVLAVAAAKVFWQWLTTSFWHWLSVDMWGWITDRPWWSALIASPIVLTPVLVAAWLFAPRGYGHYTDEVFEDEEPAALTYPIHHLAVMHPTDFEKACAALLVRDGFTSVRHSGRSGDLGADVIVWDHLGRKVVVQCKHYNKPVGSRDVQTFNGTARPEHDSDVPVMIGLNGFTRDAAAFGTRQNLILVNRSILTSWAHGTHLYDAIDEDADRAAA
ncbi:restriction endonuclease [Kitasatospora brasiliensis]|uniref:restriction endonuclease n=1 Tax=Kitasatospora brasiliensis TaxID=3058040 RepID=UPI00292D484E|nr:restriction endonuclease [Kitasatospora sp. K002]